MYYTTVIETFINLYIYNCSKALCCQRHSILSQINKLIYIVFNMFKGCRGRDQLDLHVHLAMQSVPITTNVMSSNSAHDEVYSIQHICDTYYQ